MPDITMCSGIGCPIKKLCRRFTATPDSCWQAYFVSVPYDPVLDKCDHFMPQFKFKKTKDNSRIISTKKWRKK